MPALSYVQKSLAKHEVSREDLPDVAHMWLGDCEEASEKFLRIAGNSGVETRRFIQPYEQILGLNGLEHRAAQFEEHGTDMLVEVITRLLKNSPVEPEDIGALVFTSCSVPLIPSIDAAAILKSNLPPTVSRIPIYQHGCAGGVVGLGLGAKLCELGKPVIVSSVELCSLVFQPSNHSGAHLVGGAIFADGAAATMLFPKEGELTVLGSESHLIPESRHLMGYDIFDDGFHLRLDRTLPQALVAKAPEIVGNFLSRFSLTPSDIDYWLFHPGGIRILDFLRENFQLSKDQCVWSYQVLKEHGNLSSATILYVLDSFLSSEVVKPGEKVLIMGIGPGLTIEMILLER